MAVTLVLALLLMGVFLLGFWLLHFRVETRHVHAERHLAKAGVARRKGRGISHPWSGGGTLEWKGRSEAEVCTSEARKTAGNPLRRVIGAEPLSEVWLPYPVRYARLLSGPALRAGTGPLW